MLRSHLTCVQPPTKETGLVERIFKWGRGRGRGRGWRGVQMRKRKSEQTREVQRHEPPENFKFKSSEMTINASKTASSHVNL